MTTDTFAKGAPTKSAAVRPIERMVRRAAREPLVHFLVLGTLLFVANAVLTPAIPKERLIEVTPEVRQSIVDTYKEATNHEPTPDELNRLIDTWILNEITYREALAQGLDKGDDMIRERIMQKMRLLIFSNITVEQPTETDLEAWLDSRRARFDVPERLSFFDLPIGGPDAQAEAEETLRQIRSGTEPESVRARAQGLAQRPRSSVEEVFGKPFVDALVELPLGSWQALAGDQGWHIVRLDEIAPGRPVTVDEVRSALIGDWQQERARALAIAAVKDMGKSYIVRRVDQP
jgi:hypothetical protein